MKWVLLVKELPTANSPKLYTMLPVLPPAKAEKAAEHTTVKHIGEVWVRYEGVDAKLLKHEYVPVTYAEFVDYIDITHEPVWYGKEHYYTVKGDWVALFD